MGALLGNSEICKKVADALGIKNCRWLNIDMHVGGIVTVKTEFYPEEDGVAQIITIFSEYQLVRKGA